MSQINLDQPSYECMQQAVEWFVVLNDQEVSEQDRTDWQRWLQEPQHAEAWQLVESVNQRFSMAGYDTGRKSVGHSLKAARQDRISRRRVLQAGGVLGLFGWLSLQYTPMGTMAIRASADYASQTGEIKPITLQDGSQLWLNTASAINVQYSAQQRLIELVSGEILIQTGVDALKREFLVATAQGTLRALGTQFTVREQDDKTFVAVYEGAVEILTQQGQSQVVQAGQQTSFSVDTVMPLVAADPARQAWSDGLIVANDISLRELVAELGRYRQGYLTVDPAVADQRVIGTFPIDKPDHALSMLEDSLPVKVQAPVPWWVSISKK